MTRFSLKMSEQTSTLTLTKGDPPLKNPGYAHGNSFYIPFSCHLNRIQLTERAPYVPRATPAISVILFCSWISRMIKFFGFKRSKQAIKYYFYQALFNIKYHSIGYDVTHNLPL